MYTILMMKTQNKYHSEASLNVKTQLKLLNIPLDKLGRKINTFFANRVQTADSVFSSQHFQHFGVYTGPDFNPDACTHVDTNNHKFSNSEWKQMAFVFRDNKREYVY